MTRRARADAPNAPRRAGAGGTLRRRDISVDDRTVAHDVLGAARRREPPVTDGASGWGGHRFRVQAGVAPATGTSKVWHQTSTVHWPGGHVGAGGHGVVLGALVASQVVEAGPAVGVLPVGAGHDVDVVVGAGLDVDVFEADHQRAVGLPVDDGGAAGAMVDAMDRRGPHRDRLSRGRRRFGRDRRNRRGRRGGAGDAAGADGGVGVGAGRAVVAGSAAATGRVSTTVVSS